MPDDVIDDVIVQMPYSGGKLAKRPLCGIFGLLSWLCFSGMLKNVCVFWGVQFLGLVMLVLCSTFNWTIPFQSWLAICALSVAMLITYLVPLRYLILLWGKSMRTVLGSRCGCQRGLYKRLPWHPVVVQLLWQSVLQPSSSRTLCSFCSTATLAY